MLFMNGIYFALQSGSEHHDLRHDPPQLQLEEQAGKRACLRYCEDVSKNHQRGLKGRHVKPKVVVHYANIDNPSCCFIRLYKLYQSKCPPNHTKNAFYLRPLQKPNAAGFWYSTQPAGHSKLDGTVARMCKAAGIGGFKTNHSLRATAAT